MRDRCIIFDFDGTIADTLGAVVEVFNIYASEKGYTPLTEANLPILRAKDPARILLDLGVRKYQLPFLAYRARRDLASRIPDLSIFPGMKEAIGELRAAGYRLALLSVNSEENVRAFLAQNGIPDFDDYLCSASVLFGKAGKLRRYLRRKELDPRSVVLVGDEVRDIEAARKAGTKIICVSWGFHDPSALMRYQPDALVSEAGKIPGAVRELLG